MISARVYRVRESIGSCRYVVNYHDGIKANRDGSPFFDVAIFRNRRDLGRFLASLEQQGYAAA